MWCIESLGKEEGRAQCRMLLRIDDKNEECPLDLVKSLADLGGSSSIGQMRSEFPDVRGLRNNLEE